MTKNSRIRTLTGLCWWVSCAVTLASLPTAAAAEALPDEQNMTSEQREILDRDAAAKYMVELINRDRKSANAPPVVLDETASQAGQLHSDEMAVNGYLSHWTMDGHKPDQRYTEAGGKDSVMENAYVSLEGTAYEEASDANKLELPAAQVFHRYELDKIESVFINEKPPADGHRQNIINPAHTKVGIGLSFASRIGRGVRTACTQEFINHHGEYSDVPPKIAPGDKLAVAGTLDPGVHVKAVELRYEALPKPMTMAQLGKTGAYGIPDTIKTSFYPFTTAEGSPPIIVSEADGKEKFSIDIVTGKDWKPGLYYLTVWASLPGENGDKKQPKIISCRTITIEP